MSQQPPQPPRTPSHIMADILDIYRQEPLLICEICRNILTAVHRGVRSNFWTCTHCNRPSQHSSPSPSHAHPRQGHSGLADDRGSALSPEESVGAMRRAPLRFRYVPTGTIYALATAPQPPPRDLQQIPTREIFEEAGGLELSNQEEEEEATSESTQSDDTQSILASESEEDSDYNESDDENDNSIPSQQQARPLIPWTTFRNTHLSGSRSNHHPGKEIAAANEPCPICYQDYNALYDTQCHNECPTAVTRIRLPCQGQHEICLNCARNWFQGGLGEQSASVRSNKNTCPMCREKLFEFEEVQESNAEILRRAVHAARREAFLRHQREVLSIAPVPEMAPMPASLWMAHMPPIPTMEPMAIPPISPIRTFAPNPQVPRFRSRTLYPAPEPSQGRTQRVQIAGFDVEAGGANGWDPTRWRHTRLQ